MRFWSTDLDEHFEHNKGSTLSYTTCRLLVTFGRFGFIHLNVEKRTHGLETIIRATITKILKIGCSEI